MPKQKKSLAEKQAIKRQGREEFKQGLKDMAKSGAKAALNKVATGNAGAVNIAHTIKGGITAAKGAIRALFNDLTWYSNYKDATKEMIGLNFNVIQGVTNTVENPAQNGTYQAGGYAAAGVVIHPSLGDNTNANISAGYNRLFTAIRQANSGAVNWNKVDLQTYIHNIRMVVMLYTMGCRALRELNRESILVRSNPALNFAAMGLDYDTIAENAANLRNLLINAKIRLASYAAPKIALLERTQWMFRGGFWDSNDIKHQIYYFRPIDFTTFMIEEDEPVFDSNTLLASLTSTATGLSYTAYTTALTNAIASLVALPNCSIISGDIAKAYGLDNLFYLDAVPTVNDKPIEGYNEEVLTEIQNAWNPVDVEQPYVSLDTFTSSSDGIMGDSLVIGTQHRNTASEYQRVRNSSVVNMYKDHISNEEVVMATRLQVLYDNSTWTAHGQGSEVFMSIRYYGFDPKSTIAFRISEEIVTSIESISVPMSSTYIEYKGFQGITAACRFAYAPRIVPVFSAFPSGSTSLVSRMLSDIMDYNVYAFIRSYSVLVDISNIANQSLLYTPLLLRASNSVVEY